MKKIVFVLLAFSISLSAQESVVDSLEIQNLEEVIVSSIRVKENIPIAFNNVSKEEISKSSAKSIPELLSLYSGICFTVKFSQEFLVHLLIIHSLQLF